METLTVQLNTCVDDVYENDISCDRCKKNGTVVIIFNHRICKWCLREADVAISRAILNKAGIPPYLETPTAGGTHVPSED